MATFVNRIGRALLPDLTNPLAKPGQLAERLRMLTRPMTTRRALWTYAAIVPVAGLLLMCAQEPDLVRPEDAKTGAAPNVRKPVYTVVENNPEFPGGIATLGAYLGQNLRYPEAAKRANVSGKVFVAFTVGTDGGVSDVQILKGVGFGCDEEAVRVVEQMPRWQPGRQDGQPVAVRYNLPIAFELEE